MNGGADMGALVTDIGYMMEYHGSKMWIVLSASRESPPLHTGYPVEMTADTLALIADLYRAADVSQAEFDAAIEALPDSAATSPYGARVAATWYGAASGAQKEALRESFARSRAPILALAALL